MNHSGSELVFLLPQRMKPLPGVHAKQSHMQKYHTSSPPQWQQCLNCCQQKEGIVTSHCVFALPPESTESVGGLMKSLPGEDMKATFYYSTILTWCTSPAYFRWFYYPAPHPQEDVSDFDLMCSWDILQATEQPGSPLMEGYCLVYTKAIKVKL